MYVRKKLGKLRMSQLLTTYPDFVLLLLPLTILSPPRFVSSRVQVRFQLRSHFSRGSSALFPRTTTIFIVLGSNMSFHCIYIYIVAGTSGFSKDKVLFVKLLQTYKY